MEEQSYAAEELATSLQASMNEASWFGAEPYSCTYNESTQTMLISKPVDDNSFCLANDDLLLNPGIRTYVLPRTAQFATWEIDYNKLESAMGLFGLGEHSSVNKTLGDFVRPMPLQI